MNDKVCMGIIHVTLVVLAVFLVLAVAGVV